MPAGLAATVLASRTLEERPAKAVPMPLALCSLMARPFAIAWVDRAPIARASVVFIQACFIDYSGFGLKRAGDANRVRGPVPAKKPLRIAAFAGSMQAVNGS